MGFFPGALAAHARGSTVREALLAHFDFATDPYRVHEGFGALRAAGQLWQGLGGLGRVSELERAIGATAPTAVFTLSGVDPTLIGKVSASKAQVKGRTVSVYLQFFDEDWQPYDNALSMYRGVMDVMSIQRPSKDTCTIQVTAETRYARRAVPGWGWLADRDQRRRYPDDACLRDMGAMVSRSRPWNPSNE